MKTGLPSSDKPWLKYYTEEQINAELPKCKIFDYIWINNKDYQDRVALNYFDRKITYGEVFSNIEKAARAFSQIGVKQGDVVAIIAVTLPETIYALYALNRIGAIANMIDPRTSEEGIKAYIEETNTKIVVTLDMAFEKVCSSVDELSIEKVIVVSPADSLTSIKKNLYKVFKAPRIKVGKSCEKWKQFIGRAGGQEDIKDTPYSENECCVIMHTGGTTGTPKGVMLSNDNLNCSAFQCFNSSIDFQREHNWLDIMPPFIAYGVGNGLHLPLVTGAEVVLIPAFDPNEFDKLLIKYKPVHMVGVPSHYERIINSPLMENADLSYIVAPVVGGDSISRELEEKTNKFLRNHKCSWNLVKGYGMTEVSAAVSVCVSNESNKIGGTGIPFAHTIISIFDVDTGKELTYNQKGEVCMTGPNTMLGYYNNEEETSKVLKKHEDGRIWVHSGDYGYMDEDGQLFIEGRLKRMIVRHDGFKIYPNLIESVIQKSSYVHEVCSVGKKDKEHAQGSQAMVYVVLKRDASKPNNEIISELKELCSEMLPEYAQPWGIRIIDQLPLTSIGKVDYRELERRAAEDSEKD